MTQPMAKAPTILQVQQLELKINQLEILKKISFDVNRGEFVGLLGPNGAGKSSLLRCLYRYVPPSRGSVSLYGKQLERYTRQAYAKKVAVVLQEVPEQFNLEMHEVVAMGLTPHKTLFSCLGQKERQLIDAAIDKVELTHKSHQIFSSLSGGEKQRVMIARAIVQQPELLIMDEPTSHLDVKYQIQIMELAKSLGISVLASFHDLNLASAMSDKLLVLKGGKLVAQGDPADVITPQLLSDVFGVCAEVSRLPSFQGNTRQVPHIRYHYGYIQ